MDHTPNAYRKKFYKNAMTAAVLTASTAWCLLHNAPALFPALLATGALMSGIAADKAWRGASVEALARRVPNAAGNSVEKALDSFDQSQGCFNGMHNGTHATILTATTLWLGLSEVLPTALTGLVGVMAASYIYATHKNWKDAAKEAEAKHMPSRLYSSAKILKKLPLYQFNNK